MSRRPAVLTAAAVTSALTLGFAGATARAAEPTTQELLNQIKQLQAKVEQLEARQNQSSADVAATVDQIVKDAERRSQFLQTEGMNILAGHEKDQFFIRSADGNYSLSPSLELQIRNTTNWNTAGDDSVENGFDLRRMKIRLEGNAITPDLTYAFQWAMSNSTGTPNLEDAWVRYKFQPDWYVRGGQFKDPRLHEQLVSGRRQLTADRSLLSLVMTGSSDNYTQGVSAIYDRADGPLRAEVAFTDGVGSQNTTWRDFPENNTNWGAAGRVEYFVFGDRKQIEDFTALGNTKELLVLGAAGDITQAGSDTVYLHTLDAQWENATGASAYGAYVARFVDTSGGDSYDWGFQVQGGYLFNPRWEGFVRYDFIKLEDEVAFASGGAEDTFHEFTLGVNYYIQRHFAKFSVVGSWLPNGAPSNQIGLGELAGSDAEFVLRAQFQLVL
jgi:hypothetical protein